MTPSAALIRLLLCAVPLWLSGCASYPDGDPLVSQMRSGGACAPAPTPDATAPAPSSSPQPPAPQPQHIDLQGQMSIKLQAFGDQPAKGLSLGFFFSGNAERGQLDLMTLMGSQMAQVNWQPDQVWLTNDKGRQRYASLAELSDAALGEAIPFQQLIYWMQGQPDPHLPSVAGETDTSFQQLGWTIDASDFAAKKLQARREATPLQRGVQLKIYLDR